jgi:polysaccharide export outer membrane protein
MNASRNRAIILFLLMSVVCVANLQAHAAAPEGAPPFAESAAGTSDALVRVGPGDLLQITVFDIPELTQTIRVSDQGDAVINLVGTLHLGGLTDSEAQTLIEKRLRDGNFVQNPHVTVLTREYVTQGVSVLGEVHKPGVYPALGRRTLLDIISEAGGITLSAAHEVTIKRHVGGGVLKASLSNNPGELLADNVEVQPGDTVIVPKAGIVYVLGDVGRPGGYVIENDGHITLLQALALAGGVNRSAAYGKTRIVRKTPTGSGSVPVDFKRIAAGKEVDLVLEHDDIVYVPSSTVKSVLERAPAALQSAASSASVYAIAP